MLTQSEGNEILLITNIPNPYRIPLFNELKRQLEGKKLRLKVIFGAWGYERRKWTVDMSECDFDYEVLTSKKIHHSNPEKTDSFSYSGLGRIISRERPLAVITNAFSIATTKLWLRSWFKQTKYIIWSGAINRNNRPESVLRRLQRKILIRRASGFVAYGTKAKEYLRSLGANIEKIHIGINTVDTGFFETKTIMIRKQLGNKTKKKHVLYIGNLIGGKRVDHVLYVVRDLSMQRQGFVVELVGSGEGLDSLRSLAQKLHIENLVKFVGFKQKSDIPQHLARADCFLFPTGYDIWGLVLVEAMAAGLPCIASIHAGVTHDLIKNGVTGFAMDFAETEKVAEKIHWILENPELSREIGKNASRFIAENASLAESASGFMKAIQEVYRR